MKHLDEISDKLFTKLVAVADEVLREMALDMVRDGLCPVCFCHLMAEAARSAAKKLEETTNHAKTH